MHQNKLHRRLLEYTLMALVGFVVTSFFNYLFNFNFYDLLSAGAEIVIDTDENPQKVGALVGLITFFIFAILATILEYRQTKKDLNDGKITKDQVALFGIWIK